MTPPRPSRALVALMLLACSRGTPAEEPAPRTPPTSEAEISTRSLDAPSLAGWIAQPGEKVRVVNFWATWCQPCLAEMPVLREFARRNRSAAELTFVNVDVPVVRDGRVPPMLRKLSLGGFDHVMLDAADPNSALRDHLPGWPAQIPLTLVIARDGTVVARFAEAIHGPELDDAVRRASAHPSAGPG